MLILLPFFLILDHYIIRWIYSRTSKAELFGYFEKLPTKRKSLGKLNFILYSILSIVVALLFAIKVSDQRDTLKEPHLRKERIEQIRKDVFHSDSLNSHF